MKAHIFQSQEKILSVFRASSTAFDISLLATIFYVLLAAVNGGCYLSFSLVL